MTPELQSKISVWRHKAAEGTLTEAELVEAMEALRGGRISAAQSSEKAKRTKAKAAIPTADDMLKELGL